MPTALPPRTANNQASRLSAVMFTLVAAMLTMLIALYEMHPNEMDPTAGSKAATIGFAFDASVNQSPTNSYD